MCKITQVYVGTTLCGDVKWEADKSVYRVKCHGATGNMVKVTQDDEYLVLCEVEVLGNGFAFYFKNFIKLL